MRQLGLINYRVSTQMRGPDTLKPLEEKRLGDDGAHVDDGYEVT